MDPDLEQVTSAYDLVLHAPRAITPDGEMPLCVAVTDGTIVRLEPLSASLIGKTVVELGQDVVLLPGLVDSHVHVNEPGRTEWEGFASATKAAAAGGVTTIIDMPLNSIPPTTTIAGLAAKRGAAAHQAFVNIGFWGGAVPDNIGDLHLLHEEGVFGFKCFLLHSGVVEFPHLSHDELQRALHEVASLETLMIVHAEDRHSIDHAAPAQGSAYREFLRSRPRGAENLAVAQVIELARRTGARTHVLHLSSSDAIPMIRSARRDGVRLSVETCPHYLVFSAEEISPGATQFKCCPPIRETENRELLWGGLTNGDIDFIASDHSPCTVDLKQLESGDFGLAWGGISSLQVALPAVWTEARKRGMALTDVVAWMAQGPADQTGLTRKGRIAVGADADLCVFAPDESFVVDVASLHHKNPVSAYDGRSLVGVVKSTWLAGTQIDIQAEPRGQLLRRGTR